MIKYNSLIIFTLFALWGLSSCSNTPGVDENGNEIFEEFYAKFITDTTFQKSRIEFPLMVIPNGKYTPNENQIEFREETEWVARKYVDYTVSDTLKNRIIKISDDYMKEEIIYYNAFYFRYEYNLDPLSKKWFLTKHVELQEAAKVYNPQASTPPLTTDTLTASITVDSTSNN